MLTLPTRYVLLALAGIAFPLGTVWAQEAPAPPAQDAPAYYEVPRESTAPLILRGRSDGSAVALQGGKVVGYYPKGSLRITSPSPEVLAQEQQRREADAAARLAEAEEKAAEATAQQKAATAEAQAEQRAEAARQKAAAERVEAYKAGAVTVLNDTTGVYEQVVPLQTLQAMSARQASAKSPQPPVDYESQAVSIRNGNTGNFVQAVRLSDLVPSDAEEKTRR